MVLRAVTEIMVKISSFSAFLPAGSTVDTASAADKAQQTINAAIPSLSPSRPSAVPRGGLLTSIQNTSSQDKAMRVEKVEIHTAKPMSPLEMENMMAMAVGG